MDHENKQPRCSIAKIDNRIIVTDHRNDDRKIEPSCGVDAMALYTFLKSQVLRNPAYDSMAEDLLVDIADGKLPVSELIESVRDSVCTAEHAAQYCLGRQPQRSMAKA